VSLKTWKVEFYPVPADQVSKADALDHSIRKWEGLTKINLKKHGLIVDGTELSEHGNADSESFFVDAESCALCANYQHRTGVGVGWSCGECPLFLLRGGMCCESVGRELSSPFDKFDARNDPIPMLNLLKRAKVRGAIRGKAAGG